MPGERTPQRRKYPVGEVHPSQPLFTYGVGSLVRFCMACLSSDLVEDHVPVGAQLARGTQKGELALEPVVQHLQRGCGNNEHEKRTSKKESVGSDQQRLLSRS